MNFLQLACPCCGRIEVDRRLVEMVGKLEDAYGEDLWITSGYRCSSHNAMIPGASPKSQHILGKAVDIRCAHVDSMAVIAKDIGFTGVIQYTWGVHVDIREGAAYYDDRR